MGSQRSKSAKVVRVRYRVRKTNCLKMRLRLIFPPKMKNWLKPRKKMMPNAKCLKPTWRGRHASICKSCEIKGVIKPLDKKDENQIEKCKKCVRRKFKARHATFCDECPAPDLYEEDQNVNSEHKKNKKKTSLIKSMSEQEDEEDQKAVEESKDKRKHQHKNKTKKNGDTNKSNKKDDTEQNEKVKTKHQLKT